MTVLPSDLILALDTKPSTLPVCWEPQTAFGGTKECAQYVGKRSWLSSMSVTTERLDMPNWKNAKPELLQQIVQEGETYLQGQLTLATSADQRAAVLGGIFAASGTALTATLIAAVSTNNVAVSLLFGGAVSAALFLVAAGLCLLTALPVGFDLPGNEPKSWYGDVENGTEIHNALAEEAENYQEKIVDNRNVLKSNAVRFRLGAITGIAAPFVGAIIWMIGAYCLKS